VGDIRTILYIHKDVI